MKPRNKKNSIKRPSPKVVPLDRGRMIVRDLSALSGKDLINRVLEFEKPAEVIKGLSEEDFFWLVKKIGDDDSLAVLETASEKQWQYLFDLELWQRDRMNLARTYDWVRRLNLAAPERVARWFFNEGQALAYFFFSKSLEVIAIEEEEQRDNLSSDFFTFDGSCYIRTAEAEQHETFEKLLRHMAKEDFTRFQALLLGLRGLIPAESEENLFRMRNVRLAEHGFLPLDEAISVYSPLEPDCLKADETALLPGIVLDAEAREVVPAMPLMHSGERTMLTEALERVFDPLIIDRFNIEFAGLCNKIISADGNTSHDLETLISTCTKAAGHISLALERQSGGDMSRAEGLLKNNSFESFFRVGLGLTLKVKWEAMRWLKKSWYHSKELSPSFWGDSWGGKLTGIISPVPLHHAELEGGEEYREFRHLSELTDTMSVIRRLMVLDSMLERLDKQHGLDEDLLMSPESTFRPIVFALWFCLLFDREISISPLPLDESKKIFQFLRADEKEPPFSMEVFRETFINDLVSFASSQDKEAEAILSETLSLVWEDFREEYEWVATKDLDAKYSGFILRETRPHIRP